MNKGKICLVRAKYLALLAFMTCFITIFSVQNVNADDRKLFESPEHSMVNAPSQIDETTATVPSQMGDTTATVPSQMGDTTTTVPSQIDETTTATNEPSSSSGETIDPANELGQSNAESGGGALVAAFLALLAGMYISQKLEKESQPEPAVEDDAKGEETDGAKEAIDSIANLLAAIGQAQPKRKKKKKKKKKKKHDKISTVISKFQALFDAIANLLSGVDQAQPKRKKKKKKKKKKKIGKIITDILKLLGLSDATAAEGEEGEASDEEADATAAEGEEEEGEAEEATDEEADATAAEGEEEGEAEEATDEEADATVAEGEGGR